MAVSAFPLPRARAPQVASTLPAGVLLATLLAPAFDLLRMLQPGTALVGPASIAAAAAAVMLLLLWARYPRTSWLAGAAFAAAAGAAMRLIDADVAPMLSLLAVLAIGLGGGFASRSHELETLFELNRVSSDDSSGVAPRPASDRLEPPRAA